MNVNAAANAGNVRLLADGNQVPVLGLGVWQGPDGPACVNAVRWALDAGYRHIDTAQAYGNEESVGRALRDSGVARDEVFVTTKFHPGGHDPVGQAEQSLRRLGLEQIDLYLVHWPQGGPAFAWKGMERVLDRGLARSIGVSNFSAADLEVVIAAGSVPPAVNQVLFNPRHLRRCSARRVRTARRRRRGVQPARHRPVRRQPDRGQDRSPDRPDAGPGAAAVVPAARGDRRRQIDASRPHSGERADLRLHALRRRHDRTRPDGQDRRN